MFDLLKKKLTGFIDKITKKEEKVQPTIEEIKPASAELTTKEIKIQVPKKVEKPKENIQNEEPLKKLRFDPQTSINPEEFEQIELEKKEMEPPKEEKKEGKKGLVESVKNLIIKKKEPPKKELSVKLGITKQIKGIITGEIELEEKDVSGILDTLEIDLLESDVALEVAEIMKRDLGEKLIGKKIKKEEVNNYVKKTIKDTILQTISSDKTFDLKQIIKTKEKPVKIMVLGTNGVGKTTSIAKIAKLLIDNGQKIVFAASDTFRAAAIEQMTVHAENLGVKIIKRDYGADPTAVAYDAINYAKAHNIDVVIVDTAGRQDTNLNLINELKKMNRVIEPTLKIYVAESIAGNAIIEQVSTFKEEIGIDGVILTKVDCDAKGGSVLSILKTTGVPIIYLGTGQRYEDFEKFEPEKIAEMILS